MPAFFLELFSEEIPARMQSNAAAALSGLVKQSLGQLLPPLPSIHTFFGPRRLAVAVDILAAVPAAKTSIRGPRASAPEQALSGFLRRNAATRDQLRTEGDYYVVDVATGAISAESLIASEIPKALREFPWPKSMRWGGTSHFTWVRPLRRIVCLLDGEVVPFDLRDGTDDGHGLVASNLTEGHRFHAPGAFAVSSAADWALKLRERKVLVDAADRKQVIAEGLARIATEKSITIADDPGLLDEVAGLVEWPVPLAGRIADEHMDLPPEVMQVSMRINQRYFAARSADGKAAPWFIFVSNIVADDGGAATIAGNERVLRARFADARHFWDLDRKARLESLVPSLERVTFHAKLGTQGARVLRLRRLAGTIAPAVGAGAALADRAAELAKADLGSGMVGEFPELQGVMGRYYALHDNEDAYVADAIRDHYAPRGPADPVPTAPVSIAVALADKLDQLACFFAIDERPTGAGDPYALRRAALGVIRIVRENGLRVPLLPLLNDAVGLARADAAEQSGQTQEQRKQRSEIVQNEERDAVRKQQRLTALEHDARPPTRAVPGTGRHFDVLAFDILDFLAERLRVQLRAEGARHDVLTAVFAAGADDDIVRLLARTAAVAALLGQNDGVNLLAAYRRAANILRIEERKDGPHADAPDADLLVEPAERVLHDALSGGDSAAANRGDFAKTGASHAIETMVHTENYAGAMAEMASLRGPLDAFFEQVTVNAPEPNIRRNRLRLLNQVRTTMDRVADFSRIEG
jgi:glycyl-tRNA synthetase beta chain